MYDGCVAVICLLEQNVTHQRKLDNYSFYENLRKSLSKKNLKIRINEIGLRHRVLYEKFKNSKKF